jgi:hypothetical protein
VALGSAQSPMREHGWVRVGLNLPRLAGQTGSAWLREEGVTFQRLRTWKASKDPHYAVRKARVEHLYAIADREIIPDPPGWW